MLVIDGNSILNRAYYGIRPLTNKNGLYTHAVYGMITILSRHVEALKPDYCVVAFDLKAPTFRHKMYSAYKANRKGMPEELAVQLPYAKQCMSALGFRVVTKEGYEADDILGAVSRIAANNGVHAYILTGDRDSLQLITENVDVLLVKNKETVDFDRNLFIDTYGIEPSAFVDVKALMGDQSDNIPGVAGIGEKTALKLIQEFGSLDALYSEYEGSSLTAGVKQKLADGKAMAYLSQTLALIDTAAPIDTALDDCEYNGENKEELYRLFSELEFSALIKKFGLESVRSASSEREEQNTESKNRQLTVLTPDEGRKYFAGKATAVYADGEKLWLCDGTHLCTLDTYGSAAELITNIKLVTHDLKKLYKELSQYGIKADECYFDTMLAAYVLDSNRNNYELEELARIYLGDCGEATAPVETIYRLYARLSELVEKQDCQKLLYDIEQPLARVLAEMELTGFKISVDGITEYGKELAGAADVLKERIYSIAGEEFNINSPKQLGEVLFEKMGLPASKKTKTGYSTDAETLQKLASKHAVIEDILDYRQVTKLKSTYADGLPRAADADGRVHSIFNQTGTATGRLSSAEPNLQNIPIKTELGKSFRRFFVPKSNDYVIIDADYSQIELRLLAHISGDEAMRAAFLNGRDVHTATAATVFGIDESEVTPLQRKKAKAVNFGIVYGIGEHSLSEDLGISRAEAKKNIESYLNGFPRVSDYLEQIKLKAREQGYVVTEFGRRRYIPELSSSNKNIQRFGERVAMNSPIQGTAADVIKIAMINVFNRLKESGIDARLILQVHDELILEAHRTCAEKAERILIECMEGAASFSVPLKVEASIGDTWYDAK